MLSSTFRCRGAVLADAQREEFLEHAWKTLTWFAGNGRQTDDMTALYLHRATTGEKA